MGIKMLVRYGYIVFVLFTACAANAQSKPLAIKKTCVSKYIQENKNFSIVAPGVLLGSFCVQQKHREQPTVQTVDSNNKQKSRLTIAQLAIFVFLKLANTFVHEAGHYCTFNFFYPGLAESIHVNFDPLAILDIGRAGYTTLNKEKISNITQSPSKQDKHKLILGFAAGSLAGLAFDTICLAGINLYRYYEKEKNIKKAFEQMKKDPLGRNLDNDFFVYNTIASGMGWNLFVNLAPISIIANDGYRILELLEINEATKEKISLYSLCAVAGLVVGRSVYSIYRASSTLRKYFREYSHNKPLSDLPD